MDTLNIHSPQCELDPTYDTVSPTGADGAQSLEDALKMKAKVGDLAHSDFDMTVEEMQKELLGGLPGVAHAKLLLCVAKVRQEVGPRSGVYLVCPEVKLPNTSVLSLPAAEAARSVVPWSNDTFQVIHLSPGKFRSMIQRATEVAPDAESDAKEVMELIQATDPRHEIVIAVVGSGVHLWPVEWLTKKVDFIRARVGA